MSLNKQYHLIIENLANQYFTPKKIRNRLIECFELNESNAPDLNVKYYFNICSEILQIFHS
jgi:hypothetical protein